MRVLKLIQNGLILLVLLQAVACAPAYYPTVPTASLFQEKGETAVNASISGGGFTVNGATALKENLALMATLNFFGSPEVTITGPNSTTTEGGASGLQLEIAPGYFNTFGTKGVFETYAGYGIGFPNGDDFQGTSHKLFIQPSIGTRTDKTEWAFTLRGTYVNFQGGAEDPDDHLFYLEPFGTFRIGGERLKFQTHLGLSIPSDGDHDFTHIPFRLEIGGHYRFGN